MNQDDIDLIVNWCFYTLAEVESNFTWNSVSWFDGISSTISIGIVQYYGLNAANLLLDMQDNALYSNLPDTLKNDLENITSWDYWSTRVLMQSERDAVAALLDSPDGRAVQVSNFAARCQGYISTLQSYGLRDGMYKAIIYGVAMMHQNPAACDRVFASSGGTATLEMLHNVRNNDYILGIYDNRYNTIYNRLQDWDGVSQPPDFGQSVPPSDGGNNPVITTRPGNIGIIQEFNGLLIMTSPEDARKYTYYKNAGQTWIPANRNAGAPINDDYTDRGNNPTAAAIISKAISTFGLYLYGNGAGRHNPDVSGYTDCSGWISWLYRTVAGIDTGLNTAKMTEFGTLIEAGTTGNITAIAEPCDLIVCSKNGIFIAGNNEHVVMVMDDGSVAGMGKDGDPSTVLANYQNYPTFYGANIWQLRRYL